MFWINNKFTKVWEVEVKEKCVRLKLGTSDKKQDGTYENSSWFGVAVGKALERAKRLKKGDTINITKGKVSDIWDKEKGVARLQVVVLEIEGEFEEDSPVDESFDNDEFQF